METQIPRVTAGPELLLAGLAQRYALNEAHNIPMLWERFAPHIGAVPGQVPHTSYGVMFDADQTSFEYLAAVEVASLKLIPADLRGLRIAPQTYAVFTHSGHISTLRDTMNAVWKTWLPASTLRALHAPSFERYDRAFDPHTGNGDVEIWIPIESAAVS